MVIHGSGLGAETENDVELPQGRVLRVPKVSRAENPLDSSEAFNELLEACRKGDLKRTQELISAGVNLNAVDKFDYTPLILASLCGHFELVELLLESGALAERDTFQGERCIHNALNDKIRNLLIEYDYSKSTDPLQPWAAHITSLFTRQTPKTSDIVLTEGTTKFELHKFVLSARSPYFRNKLKDAPETTTWKLPLSHPVESFRVVLRYLYLGDIPRDVVDSRSEHTEEEVLIGIDKICKQLEIPELWEAILSGHDRRLVRQRHLDEVNRAQQQIGDFFNRKIIDLKMTVDTRRVSEVKWSSGNSIYADCLLRVDEEGVDDTDSEEDRGLCAIPIGAGAHSKSQNSTAHHRKSFIYPVHKAMLIRSPYFATMFSSAFLEAQESEHLHVIKVDCSPRVLEIILKFLYMEEVECPLELALDLLYASDMLFLEKLKGKAAVLISSLGSGNSNLLIDRTHGGANEAGVEVEPINVYDVIHAAWDLRVQRLETFAARYLAYRLEDYIDEEEFAELIQESASRVKNREETDTIELLDDIRYYLGERFRLRFEDADLEGILNENDETDASIAEALSSQLQIVGDSTEVPAPRESEKTPNVSPQQILAANQAAGNGVRTLDGEVAEDEFASDAINYRVLLEKIDIMLQKLKLDA
ncbi:BTB/POZ domain-containing protein [Xylaria bambusicola]|uniref:BTB/POZ domain-containing protein n=1 Tax=Xylaria bambusicola TaxID=326684 RepID=UPI002008C2B6|nr:BTB/POZ domain-containing protein [Xylaria bambusicola]KAI0522164.1 BTB/POZ domain-containing protein [Xylaria bambusicola]